MVRQPAAFSFCALSASEASVDFLASASNSGERTKKKGSTAEMRVNSEFLGQGRQTASWMDTSEAAEPSKAMRILIRTPVLKIGTDSDTTVQVKDVKKKETQVGLRPDRT